MGVVPSDPRQAQKHVREYLFNEVYAYAKSKADDEDQRPINYYFSSNAMKYIDFEDPNLMDKALRAYDYHSGRLADQKEDRFNETEEFLALVKIGEEIKLKQNSFTYKGTYTEEEAEECAKAFWQ
jgi:hypothetical protein